MTTLMFHKRFVAPIQAGAKKQTIRPPRKRPIKVGDELSLRYWEGQGYRSPQIAILDTKCSGAFTIAVHKTGVLIGSGRGWIERPAELDEFARGDGFADWAEMQQWFSGEGRKDYVLPFMGVLIQWGDQ